MYTNLLKAWKGAKKLPSTIYICLEITFFWKLKERPYDHVMYVYLPFCAFVGTNDVYLSQHAVNPTSCSDFCGQHLLDCVTVSESSRRIEYHYFKRWLLIYEARVRPLLDATRKKILTRERFVAHRCCQGATRQGRRPRAQPLRRIDSAVFVDGSISCFLMSFPFVRTYKALRLV